jgi:hypothetical protein
VLLILVICDGRCLLTFFADTVRVEILNALKTLEAGSMPVP